MITSFLASNHAFSKEALQGKKILFANFPADGHFKPLTGLAVYLRDCGCDVRWYTSATYADKLRKMQIPHYTLKKALDVSALHELFPEREQIKGQVAKLKFDIIHAFILRAPEYYADLLEIQKEFDFDLVIADCAFTAIPFVTDKMLVPVISIGVLPLTETSKDLPPVGLGMTPSYHFVGRMKQALLRFITNRFLFAGPNKVMQKMMAEYGIDHMGCSVFDVIVKKSALLLQSGTPGFEYFRSDLGRNIRFIGSLLPYTSRRKEAPWFDERLNRYKKIIVVTQGTVEKDTSKLLVPTLEAFKGTETLVIATTGGNGTAELRERFTEDNLVIEEYIPFGDIMPYADVYITNGGYGGVMLGIEHELPLVVAGVHEGKNEINARIGYFGLGINLKTEKPSPAQVRKAVQEVVSNRRYQENVIRLGKEFSAYNPNELTALYVAEVLYKTGRLEREAVREVKTA